MAQCVDVDQRVARRVQRHRRRPHRHHHNPSPGRDDRKRRCPRHQMRQKGRVAVVDPDQNRHRANPGFGLQIGQQIAQNLAGAAGRGDLVGNPHPGRQIRECALNRVPQIGVTAQRTQIAGALPGQPKPPVLRPCHHRIQPRQQPRIPRQLPKDLRPKVQPPRQPRRSGQRKVRPHRVIIRPQAVRPGIFIIQYRRSQTSICRQQRSASAMGGDRNPVDSMRGLKRPQPVQQKPPDPFGVEMGIGRALQHGIRPRDHADLGPRSINQRQFGIGLADINDGYLGHGRVMAGETSAPAAWPRVHCWNEPP